MNVYSAITDIDHKLDIIDHVNQDHTEELLAIAQYHSANTSINSPKINDIFEEGIELSFYTGSEISPELMFIPFEIDGSLEDKILYSAYNAVVRQGRDFTGSGKNFFEVIAKTKITKNVVRLTIHSSTPLPEYYPGYAYAFILNKSKKKPVQTKSTFNKKHWAKNIFDRSFIWLMKNISSKNRKKLLANANKDVRLYTLRQSWKSDNSTHIDQAYIDIFTHGNTAGSLWASSLGAGDIIQSRSETADRHPHLLKGKALLVADETAYPALAGILEHWRNETAPEIILISTDIAEQDYFDAGILPKESTVHRIICPPEAQGKEVLSILEQITTIDVVWAALESESAKTIRRYLRNERKVPGKSNHTKAYWSLKSKR